MSCRKGAERGILYADGNCIPLEPSILSVCGLVGTRPWGKTHETNRSKKKKKKQGEKILPWQLRKALPQEPRWTVTVSFEQRQIAEQQMESAQLHSDCSTWSTVQEQNVFWLEIFMFQNYFSLKLEEKNPTVPNRLCTTIPKNVAIWLPYNKCLYFQLN